MGILGKIKCRRVVKATRKRHFILVDIKTTVFSKHLYGRLCSKTEPKLLQSLFSNCCAELKKQIFIMLAPFPSFSQANPLPFFSSFATFQCFFCFLQLVYFSNECFIFPWNSDNFYTLWGNFFRIYFSAQGVLLTHTHTRIHTNGLKNKAWVTFCLLGLFCFVFIVNS